MKLPDTTPAESALMAAILDDGERYAEAFELLTDDDFSFGDFRIAWKWMGELFAAALPVNMMTLHQRYGQSDGWTGIRDTLARCPAGGIVRHCAAILADKAALRRSVAALDRARAAASECATFLEARSALEGIMAQILADTGRKDTVHVRDVVDRIKARMANPGTASRQYQTGFPTIDRMTKGGIKEKHLVIVAGKSGEGKTTLATNILTNMAQNGVRVGMFSLEMDAEELTSRAAFSYARAVPDVMACLDKVARMEIHISDAPDRTVESIRAAIRLMVMRHNVQVVAVDYLQLIGTTGGSKDSRERQVASMSRQLKMAAKESGVGVIALSQLNEEGQLRESRAIEQDADIVLYVIKPEMDTFRLWLTKNRHGAKHGNVSEMMDGAVKDGVKVLFDAENFRFSESESESERGEWE